MSTATRSRNIRRLPAAPAAPDRPEPRRPSGRVRPSVAALTGVALVLLAVVLWFGVQALGGLVDAWGRSNALGAAETAATNLTTFDAVSADADTQRFLDETSELFATSFAGDRGAFVKSLQQGQVKMSGQVGGSGLVDYDGHTAHVYVVVKAQVTSVGSPQPQARDYRMELTMVDEGGWKVDRIEFVR